MLKTYSLINGELEVSNSGLKILYSKKKYIRDIFKIVTTIVLIYNFKSIIFNFDIKAWHLFFKIIVLSFVLIVALINIYGFVFKRIWGNKIQFIDLTKIEIEDEEKDELLDEDSKIEITLIKNSGRKKTINLKKEENQLSEIIEKLKKRNRMLKIEFLVDE